MQVNRLLQILKEEEQIQGVCMYKGVQEEEAKLGEAQKVAENDKRVNRH